MTIGDMLFMELVATDVVLSFCCRLNIFNGFMERDEDVFVLVQMMGLAYLTGRVGSGGDSVQKEAQRPTVSSRKTVGSCIGPTVDGTKARSRTSSVTLLTSPEQSMHSLNGSMKDVNDIENPNLRL